MSETATVAPVPIKRTVFLPFAWWPLLREVFIRSLLMYLWRTRTIDHFWMWMLSILISAVLLVYSVIRWTNINEAFESAARAKLDVSVEPLSTGFHASLVTLFFVAATIQIQALLQGSPLWIRLGVFVLLSVPVLFYALAAAWDSVPSKKPEPAWDDRADAFRTVAPQKTESLLPDLAVDRNDQLILRLEADRDTLLRRVEAFTLEGALLGALAFSAFVSIAAADGVGDTSMNAFRLDAWRAMTCAATVDWLCLFEPIKDLLLKDRLLCGVSVLALFSSLFFLSVIVARLRFSNLLAPAEYFVKLAARMNEKEEALKELELSATQKLQPITEAREKITRDIDAVIEQARNAMDLLKPVVSYMSVFRNLGVIAFMAALTAGALWVSPYLATVFLTFCAIAYSYPQLDELLRRATKKNTGFHKLSELLHVGRSKS